MGSAISYTQRRRRRGLSKSKGYQGDARRSIRTTQTVSIIPTLNINTTDCVIATRQAIVQFQGTSKHYKLENFILATAGAAQECRAQLSASEYMVGLLLDLPQNLNQADKKALKKSIRSDLKAPNPQFGL
jgi:hypothetical protein